MSSHCHSPWHFQDNTLPIEIWIKILLKDSESIKLEFFKRDLRFKLFFCIYVRYDRFGLEVLICLSLLLSDHLTVRLSFYIYANFSKKNGISLRLPIFLCACLSVPHTQTLLSLSLSLCVCVCVKVLHYLLFRLFSLSLSPSLFVSVHLSVFLLLSVYLSHSLCLPVPLSMSLNECFSFLFLPVCSSVRISLHLCLTVFPSFRLSFYDKSTLK
jgi:hypothetical protein